MYDHVSKGDVEKLTGELLKKEMAEKVKTAKGPEELGELGSVLLVAGMVKEKKAVVGFKDLKVKVTKLEGDKAEVKVEGGAALKMTVDGKEQVSDETVNDTIQLEKEEGKWKIVSVVGEKKTDVNVEVKPEGDAPKTEGEAPKTEGEPKADAPKTEGETK
jgi:uncharacterized OsmC-like protein